VLVVNGAFEHPELPLNGYLLELALRRLCLVILFETQLFKVLLLLSQRLDVGFLSSLVQVKEAVFSIYAKVVPPSLLRYGQAKGKVFHCLLLLVVSHFGDNAFLGLLLCGQLERAFFEVRFQHCQTISVVYFLDNLCRLMKRELLILVLNLKSVDLFNILLAR